jgi:hypothetical protein
VTPHRHFDAESPEGATAAIGAPREERLSCLCKCLPLCMPLLAPAHSRQVTIKG